jgi:hypothetical protein
MGEELVPRLHAVEIKKAHTQPATAAA